MQWKSADFILFDLDGTLVDSVPDLADAIDMMLDGVSTKPAGVDNVRLWVGNGAEKLVERALIWAFGNEISLHKESALFQSSYQRFLTHYEQTNGKASTLYSGVKTFLEACQDLEIPMAVVTNKPLAFTHTLLDNLAIANYFCDLAGGDSFANKKPHPQPLLELIKRNASSKALMIGDSMHDVAAAKAAGVPVICVSYGYNHGNDIHDSEPDLVVDSLASLL